MPGGAEVGVAVVLSPHGRRCNLIVMILELTFFYYLEEFSLMRSDLMEAEVISDF